MRHTWTDSDTAQLRAMAEAGKTRREIADALGFSLDTLKRHARQLGINPRHGLIGYKRTTPRRSRNASKIDRMLQLASRAA